MLVLLLSPPLWAQQGVVGKVQFTGGTVVQVTNHGYLVMERLYGREFLQRLSRHGTRRTLQQNHRGSRLRQRDRSERAACCDLLLRGYGDQFASESGYSNETIATIP
jgi:hypothetical protein